MLTDYERYQLEWMIEHGHSLKEFVQGLDLVDRDGIDSLEEAYAIWENDYGFGGEVFSNEREFKEEDLPAMNVGAHGETLRQMVADTSEMPVKAVELIKGLYVVEGAMAQDHGIDYLFDNIGILTASVRDMLSREAERGQWEGQYKSLIDKCEEMRGDEEWDCRDTDTLVDGFAKAVEHEADAAFEVARIKGDLSMYNAAYYNPETGDLIVSYLTDYEDPTVEVFSYTPDELLDEIARQGGDLENLELTAHDITADGDYSHHVATYHSTDELAESGIFGKGNLMDVSGEISLAETMSSLKSDKPVPEGLLNIDNVREWYTSAFPNDELGAELNPDLTFDDALAAIPSGTGFYDSIGAGDSVVRERIFEELCNRYGYTYDEVYDSWLNESPLPSPAISQQPEKIAVAAGYRFNLVDTRETSGIDLKGCGTVVTVDGHEYEVMKGATYEDSRKVDDLLDSHGDRPISDYRKRPQGMNLKQAVRESREASAKLAENNSGTDAPDGKDER